MTTRSLSRRQFTAFAAAAVAAPSLYAQGKPEKNKVAIAEVNRPGLEGRIRGLADHCADRQAAGADAGAEASAGPGTGAAAIADAGTAIGDGDPATDDVVTVKAGTADPDGTGTEWKRGWTPEGVPPAAAGLDPLAESVPTGSVGPADQHDAGVGIRFYLAPLGGIVRMLRQCERERQQVGRVEARRRQGDRRGRPRDEAAHHRQGNGQGQLGHHQRIARARAVRAGGAAALFPQYAVARKGPAQPRQDHFPRRGIRVEVRRQLITAR